MRDTVTYNRDTHLELTVIRPSGQTEIVKVTDPKLRRISDRMFAQMVKGTKDAGRGDMISYRTVSEVATRELTVNEQSEKDYYEHDQATKKAMSY